MSTAMPITARFNPLYRPYLVATIGLTMVASLVGIPLAIVWFCGAGQWWARHYFDKLECQISDKTLRFRKGILFQVEKTIPLENIQDVTFIEGPLLKKFHLATLKFETAGHSAGQANDMHLTGIIDAHEFRNAIIDARDALRQRAHSAPAVDQHADGQLARIETVMHAMSARLDEIASLLRAQNEKWH